MGKTTIEWATDTLNPGIYGCEEVSPACRNCYAAKMAHRQVAMGNYPEGITVKRPSGVHWSGKVFVDPISDALERIRRFPRSRGARPRVFVTSMADVLHKDVPIGWTASIVREMANRSDADWLLLSKRADRWPELARVICDQRETWPENVWAGVTIEDRARLEERAAHLAAVPARVRWWSCEPLLEDLGALDRYLIPPGRRIDLPALVDFHLSTPGGVQRGGERWDPELGAHVRVPDREIRKHDPEVCPGCRRAVDWIIVGGESGKRAKPTPPDWFRSVVRQAQRAGVPVLFKQFGEWGLVDRGEHPRAAWISQADGKPYRAAGALGDGPGPCPAALGGTWALMAPLGKDKTGRMLDGSEYLEFPGAARVG